MYIFLNTNFHLGGVITGSTLQNEKRNSENKDKVFQIFKNLNILTFEKYDISEVLL